MTNRTALLALAALWVAIPTTPAAASPGERAGRGGIAAVQAHPEAPGNQDDPAYAAYRAAYNLILEERWTEARKKLAEVASKYPKSDYVDDAGYWSAYALRHIDLEKARKAYQEFVEQYPKSTYLDDAVADLASIETDKALATIYLSDSTRVRAPRLPRAALAPIGREMWKVGNEMRRMKWSLRSTGRSLGRGMARLYAPLALREGLEEKLDPKTRLKLEALTALGEGKHDAKSFGTLKGIALDRKQPVVLREQAVMVLGDFEEHPVAPVFLDIAKNDTSEELQIAAVSSLRETAKTKDEAVNVLTQLFDTLPPQREEQCASVLFEIADVGNEKAVDFLINVARTNENYDLRSDAVYYLGSVGGEKARTALYDILEGK